MTKVSILIPFGVVPGDPAGPHRRRVWDFLRPLWEKVCERRGWQLVECTDPLAGQVLPWTYKSTPEPRWGGHLGKPQPWSTARALHDGMACAAGDVIFHYGADHLPDEPAILAAIARLDRCDWTMMYQRVKYASEHSTLRLLDAAGFGGPALHWTHTVERCIGMWGFRRTAWDLVGGVDPRFVGWGYGDDAFTMMLTEVFGPCPAGTPGDTLYELWHPGTDRVVGPENPNQRLFQREYVAHAGDRAYFLGLKNRWGR